jgi:hypothetical protein
MRRNLRAYALQFLHAFAEAGSSPTQELQPLVGPNGALMWTEVAQVRRPEPSPEEFAPSAEKLVAPTRSRPTVEIRGPEPAGNTP